MGQPPDDETLVQDGYLVHPRFIADLLVAVARADGRIDEVEADALIQLIRTAVKAPLDKSLIRSIVKDSNTRLSESGMERVLEFAGKQLAEADQLRTAICMAIDVATASHGIADIERRALYLCARSGGMQADEVDQLIEASRS